MAARPLPRPRAAMRALSGLLIATTLLIGSGCAKQDWIDRTLVTVDVTGTWIGDARLGISYAQALFELEQEGAKVKGSIRYTGGSATQTGGITGGPIEGTVAGDAFRFSQTRGSAMGELTVSGDAMNGLLSGAGGTSYPISLRRIDPSSSPASPPR